MRRPPNAEICPSTSAFLISKLWKRYKRYFRTNTQTNVVIETYRCGLRGHGHRDILFSCEHCNLIPKAAPPAANDKFDVGPNGPDPHQTSISTSSSESSSCTSTATGLNRKHSSLDADDLERAPCQDGIVRKALKSIAKAAAALKALPAMSVMSLSRKFCRAGIMARAMPWI